MKQLTTFDYIDKYNAEQARSLAKHQKYKQEVELAEMQKRGLNIRYEQALKAQIVEEKENAQELEELNEQLDKAERELASKKRAQLVAQTLNKPSVSPQDVDREIRAFLAKNQSELIEPAAKKAFKAKQAYIDAVLELNHLVEHFNQQGKLATYAINPNAVSSPYQAAPFKSAQDRIQKTLSEVDLIDLAQGKRPKSLEPIKKPVKINGVIKFVPVIEEEI